MRARGATLTASVMIVAFGAAACAYDGPATTGDLGADAYARTCASCHGTDLRGTAVGPSLLSEAYEPSRVPDEAFRVAIRRGAPQRLFEFGPMPMVGGLSAAELEAVIAHVREQQETLGFEPGP